MIALKIAIIKEIIALMAIWKPDLADRHGPKYLQIVDALSESIAAGKLKAGDKLPPHRELAYGLGVSPNTTNRAYAEAVNRALIRGEVGRGTFVRGPEPAARAGESGSLQRPSSGPVDLSRNLPLPGLAGEKLAATCAELGLSGNLAALADYQTEDDLDRHSAGAVLWLNRHGIVSVAQQTVITAGAQHGILCGLMALTRPGDLIVTEELTYQPLSTMASRLGLKIATVKSDGTGPCPDDLDRLCRERRVSAIYLTPTLHTPTGRTMPQDRREAIARVLTSHGVALIEDDVFGLFHPGRQRPIACLMPDLSVFITGTSKYLAPGLRVGFIHAATELARTMRGVVNLTCWMTPPLNAEIVTRWIADGTADELLARQVSAASSRQALARRILDDYLRPDEANGLHLWLDLPDGWTSESFTARAVERGVLVTGGSAFAINPQAGANAVRICLSHEADAERVESGLDAIRAILDAGAANAPLIL